MEIQEEKQKVEPGAFHIAVDGWRG